ncbi:MAG: GNAT family N-acetyltransferase [Spirochaetota bacterium]
MQNFHIRNIDPSDYPVIISVVNEWWGGRNMVEMLPRLFFVHFSQTSFVAEFSEKTVGFLVGLISQTLANEAYIHFVGVHPDFRKMGIGMALYERFFATVRKFGCNIVRCVTSPLNKGSFLFHQRMGFSVEPTAKLVNGLPVAENYDGKGGDRLLFYKQIDG